MEIFYIIFIGFGCAVPWLLFRSIQILVFFLNFQVQKVSGKILFKHIYKYCYTGLCYSWLEHFFKIQIVCPVEQAVIVSKLLCTFGEEYFLFTMCCLILMSILSQAASRC